MATLYPFRALHPNAADAARIAAVPYDVVSTDEARALADGNPLSFLRVSRAEIELPDGSDPYGDPVYRKAAENFAALRKRALTLDAEPGVYLYRLQMGSHIQNGLAACFSLDEYDRGVIKKHERTRRDKEDDRTRHMLGLGAHRSSTSPRPMDCATRFGCWSVPIATLSSPQSAAFQRCTSPTDIIVPPAQLARAAKCASAASLARRSAMEPMRRRCWPWHFRTIRC
jgi:hypothetical protein